MEVFPAALVTHGTKWDWILMSTKSLTRAIVRTAIIVLTILAVYWSSLDNEALTVAADDDLYVTDNPMIREITWENLSRIFTKFYFTDYLPLTFLSLAVDYHFWKLDLWGYHLTNIILHVLNTLLLLYLFRQWAKDEQVAFVAALLFALHPIQVESVAWLSERKNLLATFFFLAAFISFLYYRVSTHHRCHWYIGTLALFLCALLSKSSVVVFPLLLLLYEKSFSPSVRVADKVPFFALAALISIITVLSQNSVGAIKPYHGGSPLVTAFAMQQVFFDYLGSLLLPLNLSPLYQYHWKTLFTSFSFLVVVLWIVMIAWAILSRRTFPFFYFSLFWFLIALLPVANIIPINALRADRYLYIPAMPLFLLGSCALHEVSQKFLQSWRRPVPAWLRLPFLRYLLPFSLITAYAVATLQYNAVWQNNFTLMHRAADTDPYYPTPHVWLVSLHLDEGNIDEAIFHCHKIMAMDPSNDYPYYQLGALYYAKRLFPLAEKYLQKAMELDKNNADTHFILGLIYTLYYHHSDQGAAYFQRVLDLNPEHPQKKLIKSLMEQGVAGSYLKNLPPLAGGGKREQSP
jgi:tetratricopeptide (TPR) repeat protein